MRIGNITSSEIVSITSNGKKEGELGKPFFTYLQQCKWERMLGKHIDNEVNSKPLSWGNLMEMYYFYECGRVEYTPMMNEVVQHCEYPFWVGSPDAVNNKKNCVVEFKAPYTLTSFCTLVDPIIKGLEGYEAMGIIRDTHKQGEQYYWQCVSNAILTGHRTAEFIVYCPYLSEIEKIRQLANNAPVEDLSKYYWVAYGSDKEIPHLLDGKGYKNEYSITFDIPQSDVEFLISRIKKAGEWLGEK